MSDASQLMTSRRPRLIVTLLSMAVAAIMMFGSQTSGAQAAACFNPRICTYSGAEYTGTTFYQACLTGSYIFSFPESYSAKNRCPEPQELGWQEGGVINWKACMVPGGDRPNPGRLNVYRYRASC